MNINAKKIKIKKINFHFLNIFFVFLFIVQFFTIATLLGSSANALPFANQTQVPDKNSISELPTRTYADSPTTNPLTNTTSVKNQSLSSGTIQPQSTSTSSSTVSSSGTFPQTVRVDYQNYGQQNSSNWLVNDGSGLQPVYATATDQGYGIYQYSVPVNPSGTDTIIDNQSNTYFVGSSSPYSYYANKTSGSLIFSP